MSLFCFIPLSFEAKDEFLYSRTSRQRPHEFIDFSGCLRKVVDYENRTTVGLFR